MSTPNPYHESPFAFHFLLAGSQASPSYLSNWRKNVLAMLTPIKTSLSRGN